MKKYTIAGIEKPEKEQETYCGVCHNGDIFKHMDIDTIKAKTDDRTTEKICTVCLTKYILNKDYDNIFILDNPYLLHGEVLKKLEGIKVKGMEEKMEKFEETGVCDGHIMIQSNPVKTSEGKFVFDSCRICKMGRVNYLGKNYEGSLPKLIEMVVNNGIAKKETAELVLPELPELDLPELPDFEETKIEVTTVPLDLAFELDGIEL